MSWRPGALAVTSAQGVTSIPVLFIASRTMQIRLFPRPTCMCSAGMTTHTTIITRTTSAIAVLKAAACIISATWEARLVLRMAAGAAVLAGAEIIIDNEPPL